MRRRTTRRWWMLLWRRGVITEERHRMKSAEHCRNRRLEELEGGKQSKRWCESL